MAVALQLVVGVDPGLDGGIAVLVCDAALNAVEPPQLRKLRDDPLVAPTVQAVLALRRRTLSLSARPIDDDWLFASGRTDDDVFNRIVSQTDDCQVAGIFIEKASTRPKQGIQQAFNYGTGWGIAQGAIRMAGFPLTLVPPPVWAKVMHAGCRMGDTKARSFEACKNLFPGTSLIPEGARVPNDGLAEALLIAEYGRRTLKGKQG